MDVCFPGEAPEIIPNFDFPGKKIKKSQTLLNLMSGLGLRKYFARFALVQTQRTKILKMNYIWISEKKIAIFGNFLA